LDFDLIIIGAGINGAGVARDAALRGLKVLLLDKGDVGGGTSSGSTRLIHGGLRYLEHGEFGLVRESLRERETLLHIAPHLVRPLPFLLPIYEHARRGPLLLRLGMIAYDLLSLGKSLPRHQMLSAAEALARAPGLRQEGLRGAALYYDAQVEFAERLVVENALSAIEHGAQVITYARVSEFIVENDRVVGVEFVKDSERRSATAPMILNATGPWVDQVIAGVAPASRLIGGTKGSHLIVARFAGAPETAIYIEAKTDQRPFFVIPWNANYLIGTTDRRYDDDLDDVRIDDNEVQYLLSETNAVFPSANLQREDILHSYSGVRTLPFIKETQEQSITRRHFIRPHSRFDNLLSLVGGKLTTYRSLAEETTDLIFAKLGRTSPTCQTADVKLGGTSSPGDAASLATRLNGIYGGRATAVMELAQNPELAEVFDAETGAIAAEVVYAFEQEFAVTLVDCLMRRTMVGLNSTCGLDAVDKAAAIAKKRLGWTDERVEEEIVAYHREVQRRKLHS
jgi:glycerol-3-phosphate dehydrogenase